MSLHAKPKRGMSCCLVVAGIFAFLCQLDPAWSEPNPSVPPTDTHAIINGTFMLGGLFPAHEYDPYNSPGCGQLQSTGVLQAEAFLFALQKLQASSILGDFTLGGIAYDTCDDKSLGLRQSLKFISDSNNGRCEGDDFNFVITTPSPSTSSTAIYGVVGPSSSEVSVQVSTLLNLFCIPVISYDSTSVELSNRRLFPYFLRTVPSDIYQARGIIDLLLKFNWTYASIVYEDSDYGQPLYDNITYAAQLNDVCFDANIEISLKESVDYQAKAQQLLLSDAPVIVVVLDYPQAAQLFAAVATIIQFSGSKRTIQWIGVDGWSLRDDVVGNYGYLLQGAIALQPLAEDLTDLNNHIASITIANASLNPWMGSFLEQEHRCCYPPLHAPNACNSSAKCTGAEGLVIEQAVLGKLHFVTEAVRAYANVFQSLYARFCDTTTTVATYTTMVHTPRTPPIHRKNPYPHLLRHHKNKSRHREKHRHGGLQFHSSSCSQLVNVDGDTLRAWLSNVTFDDFRFVDGQNGPPVYSVYQLQNANNRTYVWIDVGSYDGLKYSEERYNLSKTQLQLNHAAAIVTATENCFRSCNPGDRHKFFDDDRCCWTCVACDVLDVVTGSQEDTCTPCPLGTIPDDARRNCSLQDAIYINFSTPGTLFCLILSAMGITLTVITATIFFCKFHTPFIKASARELSSFLLICIGFTFLLPFLYLLWPATVTCGLTWFLNTFFLTACAATVFVKTNRIARIFKRTTRKRPRYLSWKAQLAFVGVFIAIEVLINVAWLVAQPPHATLSRYNTDTVIQCSPMQTVQMILSLLYPILLLLCTVIYAYMTRKAPLGFNEARYIMFCVGTILALNVVLTPVYLVTEYYVVKEMVLFLNINLTGYVYLMCMFMPKLYIVLKSPEKNTPQRVMSRVEHNTNTLNGNAARFSLNLSTTSIGVQTDEAELSDASDANVCFTV